MSDAVATMIYKWFESEPIYPTDELHTIAGTGAADQYMDYVIRSAAVYADQAVRSVMPNHEDVDGIIQEATKALSQVLIDAALPAADRLRQMIIWGSTYATLRSGWATVKDELIEFMDAVTRLANWKDRITHYFFSHDTFQTGVDIPNQTDTEAGVYLRRIYSELRSYEVTPVKLQPTPEFPTAASDDEDEDHHTLRM